MKQQTLAMAADQGDGFERYRKPTRRDAFLATMGQVVPWQALCAVIEPYYPKPGNGRPPIGLERMLRMYFVQHWFNLADEACEEALLDSTALRRFVGIDLGRERVPDGTTLLKFRLLLETHKLGEKLFAKVGEVLQAQGMKVAASPLHPLLAGIASWRKLPLGAAPRRTGAAKIAGGTARPISTAGPVDLAAALPPRRATRPCSAGCRSVARHGSLSQSS